jgi:hypothetical protein
VRLRVKALLHLFDNLVDPETEHQGEASFAQSPKPFFNFSIAWSMVNVAGRWLGGKSLNVLRNSPVSVLPVLSLVS